MITKKRGDIPYLLGLIFFITAAVYFFASNWPGFERPVKIVLSLFILLFCAAAAFFYRRSHTFAYLSNWWLFLSVIAFAVATALVGQMYNSHADSYVLFLITLIPAVILAVFTRYRPLYWLSFLLFELAFWLKLYPTGTFLTYSDGEQLLIYAGAIVLHGFFYFFWRNLQEQKLSFAALAIIQFCAVYLLDSHLLYEVLAGNVDFWPVFLIFHLVYIAFMIVFWTAFMKTQKSHPFEIGIHLFFFGLYAVPNVFYIAFQIVGDFIFYAGFPMLLLLFAFSILGLRKIAALADGRDRKWKRYMIAFFTGALAFIGTLIAIFTLSSFTGILFGFSGNFSLSFLVLAVLCIGGGLAVKKETWLVVRMTLQITGLIYSFSYVVSKWEQTWPAFFIAVPFILLTGFLFQKKESILYYAAANAALLYGILHLLAENDVSLSVSTWVLFTASIGNAAVFLSLQRQPVGLAAFWLSLIFMLYSLTEKGLDSLLLHIVFLVYICWHLFKPVLQTRLYRWPVWAAFISFFIWKYYEYAWLLLHKSLTFLLLSGLFFSIWFIWGQKHTAPVPVKKWSAGLFAAVILAQSVFVLAAAWQKEQLLQKGDIAALELAPVDPRSLIQGDYVQLGYEIQNEYNDRFFNSKSAPPEGKIEVVLTPSGNSVSYRGTQIPVYEAKEFVSSGRGEGVAIKGRGRYGTLTLGIEHFFIPENTGTQWEEKTHAIIRIAENGDAILETLR
ncbi:GDYXXLXY domain-containing protein [Domibacillus indicus]|uniref:GDYXXLXY domain-containing protein n=1 Tax=Domibacillus indicus TaxID=1437523 RepID=UPI000617B76B|nr:GDYXXLXY domain-containing protein [Domibacillus indicus]